MKKNTNINKTVDTCHKEMMKQFMDNDKTVVPSLLKEKTVLKDKYKNDNTLSLEDKLTIKDRIKEIRVLIKRLNQDKKNYMLNNSNFIHNYFEKKQKQAGGNNNLTVVENFFNNEKMANLKSKEFDFSKQYFSGLIKDRLNLNDYIEERDICKYCRKGELIPLTTEGLLICNYCSNQMSNFIDCEKPSYKEPPKEVCFYAYKRINHFREIIAQFQAKETTQISDEIIEKIRQQITKERISLDKLTNSHAKEILKRLNLNKYYEHIPFIKDKLGIKPPVMSPELEQTLCNLFIDIQSPYAKFCPEGRVNFLNYYYTIYKLCELLNETAFLPYFPMLKDREKRVEQDVIWKKICEELNWEFIPTL
jgi:hypothetical protein